MTARSASVIASAESTLTLRGPTRAREQGTLSARILIGWEGRGGGRHLQVAGGVQQTRIDPVVRIPGDQLTKGGAQEVDAGWVLGGREDKAKEGYVVGKEEGSRQGLDPFAFSGFGGLKEGPLESS